jgi:hypothetical protein
MGVRLRESRLAARSLLCVGLVALLVVFSNGRADAQTLPTGSWEINANSFLGTLEITSVTPAGDCTATVFGNQTVCLWDEAAQRITFIRVTDISNPSTMQIYTGYLFRNAEGPDSLYTLAGFFEAFPGSGGTVARSVFGWFAQLLVPG